MGRMKDETGHKYGRLTVIRKSHTNQDKKVCWICRCDCGNEVTVAGKCLRSGGTKSCGCYGREQLGIRSITHGYCRGGKTKEYYIWREMIQRCENPRSRNYSYYGARGITVCDKWRKSFAAFLEDMGHRPPGYTLDRIDVNKGYLPDNCRWATYVTQQNNKRSNRLILYRGKVKTVAEWCRELGLPQVRVYMRLHRGWDEVKALSV